MKLPLASALLVGHCAMWIAPLASAQNFPQRPVRLLVPFAPGGTTDVVARGAAQRLGAVWNQQVVVDNRPGGGSLIAVEIVSNAAPDGHTLLVTGTSVVVNTSTPLAPPGVKIDIERDFAHIILFATGANVLSVRTASPFKSLKDVIAAARARPAGLTYGSSGFGSSNHFSGELLMAQAGINLVHVPYKGNAPALTDAVGGQIDMVFAGVPAQQALLKAGRLRALAIGSKKRFALIHDVPTFEEAGLPGYEMPNYFGLSAPAGTARAIVARIHRDCEALLKQPEFVQQLQGDGLTPQGGAPETFARYLRERRVQLTQLIKAADIRVK